MNWFYNPPDNETFIITTDNVMIIKSIKPEIKESGYYDYRVTWESSDINIFKTMQFLSMTADLSDNIKLRYSKYIDVHQELLRTLYFDFEDDEITMGYKRPFGNSNVLGDVYEVLVNFGFLTYDEDDEELESELPDFILQEFSRFIQDFFSGEFIIKWSGFDSIGYNHDSYWGEYDLPHHYLTRFRISLSELRDSKLKILGI